MLYNHSFLKKIKTFKEIAKRITVHDDCMQISDLKAIYKPELFNTVCLIFLLQKFLLCKNLHFIVMLS